MREQSFISPTDVFMHQDALLSDDEYHNKLKRAKLKNTQTRLAVFYALRTAQEKHLTAEDIYKIFLDQQTAQPGGVVGLTTIYRVLADFESAGIVSKVRFDSGSSTYELSASHHDHIICAECQRIIEFDDPAINQTLVDFVATKYQASIVGRTLLLYTSCTGACK